MTTHHHRTHVIGPPTTPGPAPEARQATSPRLSRPAATSTEAAPPREPSPRPPLPEPIQRAVIAHLVYRAGTLAMQVTGDPDQVERAQVLGAHILTIQLRYGTIVDFPPLSRHSPWLARVSRLATIDELLRTATQMMRVATHGNPSFAPLIRRLEAMTDRAAPSHPHHPATESRSTMSEPVSPLTAPQLLDVEQAASWCRITTNTLNHLRLQGRFAPAVKIGRRCYWRPQDILDWIEDQLEAGR